MNLAFQSIKVVPKVSSKIDLETRYLVLELGGVGGGTSIKVSNLLLDIRELSELIANTIITGADIAARPHPIIVIAGVLLIIRTLSRAMSISITELEASVFWGIVQARNSSQVTNESNIAKYANAERSKYGLPPLTENLFANALHTLEELNCIELAGGYWHGIEKYRSKIKK